MYALPWHAFGRGDQLAAGVRALLSSCRLCSKCLYPLSHITSPRASLLLALDGYCFSFHFQEQRPCETKGIPKVAQRLDFNSYMTSLHPTTLCCAVTRIQSPTPPKAKQERLGRLSRECTHQIGKTNVRNTCCI